MPKNAMDILLVESDATLAEMIQSHFTKAIDARVTWVTTVADALCEELTGKHDLLIVASELPDGEGLALLEQVHKSNDGPAILLAVDPEVDDVVNALREGVCNFFIKPFDMSALTEAAIQLLDRVERKRRQALRTRRLRRTASQIIRERHDLRERMELICQDIVSAYRDLALKVSASVQSGVEEEDSHAVPPV